MHQAVSVHERAHSANEGSVLSRLTFLGTKRDQQARTTLADLKRPGDSGFGASR
jgi:hypothetical protein